MGLVFADLHIHSHYSRATSPAMNIESLSKAAKIKGISILGTGDFTHPKYFNELKDKLTQENGIYELNGTKFIPSAEISLIYSQKSELDKKNGRRVHLILLAPDLEVVGQINEFLAKIGRLDYDGRPIFARSCIEITDALMRISKDVEIIPSHIWTPWFSLFGSMSGFNSVEDCFKDTSKHIHALETGLSSDPRMNWRLSQLDRYTLVSFSDSHSPYPWRLGRECCAFDIGSVDYKKVIEAIRTKNAKELPFTIEFFPEEGKYHFDGHRNCNFSCPPEEAEALKNICPVCKRPLTIGVLHRVNELADREEGYEPNNAIPFKSFLPLQEIVAAVLGAPVAGNKTRDIYNKLVGAFGSEFAVMLDADEGELAKATGNDLLVKTILENRGGRIHFKPGYDGVYGVAMIGEAKEDGGARKPQPSKVHSKQKGIGDFA